MNDPKDIPAEGQESDAGLDHGTATDSQGQTVALPSAIRNLPAEERFGATYLFWFLPEVFDRLYRGLVSP